MVMTDFHNINSIISIIFCTVPTKYNTVERIIFVILFFVRTYVGSVLMLLQISTYAAS